MPSDANLATEHLAYHRAMGGVPVENPPPSTPKADNTTPTVSGETAATTVPIQGGYRSPLDQRD